MNFFVKINLIVMLFFFPSLHSMSRFAKKVKLFEQMITSSTGKSKKSFELAKLYPNDFHAQEEREKREKQQKELQALLATVKAVYPNGSGISAINGD